MSYALDSTQTNPRLRDTDYNHFVIFDPFNVIACHDFEVHLHCLFKLQKILFQICQWPRCMSNVLGWLVSHSGDACKSCRSPLHVLPTQSTSSYTATALRRIRARQQWWRGRCGLHA